MSNPIRLAYNGNEYSVQVSSFAVKHFKYFDTYEDAFEYIRTSPNKCIDMTRAERQSVPVSWNTNPYLSDRPAVSGERARNQGNHRSSNDVPAKSRLMVVLHFWAGICLYVAAKASGLLQLVFGSPAGLNPGLAVTYSVFYASVSIAILGGGYWVSKHIVNSVERLDLKKQTKVSLKIALVVIYPAFVFVGGYIAVAILVK